MSSIPRTTNWHGLISFLIACAITATGVGLALFSFWLLPVAWIMIAVGIWHWFSIVHSAGHRAQFKSPSLNVLSGLIASIFSGLPYLCWKRVHSIHHRFNNSRAKDPTLSPLTLDQLSPLQKGIVDFLWKYHVPIFGLSFVISTFYYLPKMFRFARSPGEKLAFTANVALVIAAHVFFARLGGAIYWLIAVPSLLLFCFSADPVLLGQHCFLDAKDSLDYTKPLSNEQQDELTRTLSFGNFTDRWIFAHFANHTVHHVHPTVPHHLLHLVSFEAKNEVSGWKWFRESRKIKGSVLVFGSPKTI